MGITQHTSGTDNVFAIANLAMLTGNIGRESTGVNPLRGQNNVQGACDMGALPPLLPGYQKVIDAEVRAKFESAWDVKLPDKPGLTVVEMLNEAGKKIKAMYIMGENPMISDPDITHVEEGLKELDFLVVQDIFLTETAKLADVVLPAVSFAEKNGTFTNTERRVQLVRKAIEPIGAARPDCMIIVELANKMGYKMQYESSAAIMDEISKLTPSYAGISHQRLEKEGGIQWPCTNPNHPGTKFLHKDKFVIGKGKFKPIKYKEPAEVPDDEYPFRLTTGRMLYHYHTGSMSRRSKGLDEICKEGYIEINPQDANSLGINNQDTIVVSSRRGKINIKAKITDRVDKGVVFIPFHFAESAANVLTNTALDPIAKIPELKVCAVRIEK
jgi:predicted molibdopterin-dependent oxidoreductase YjgC